jgi:hypothetical protein
VGKDEKKNYKSHEHNENPLKAFAAIIHSYDIFYIRFLFIVVREKQRHTRALSFKISHTSIKSFFPSSFLK